METDPSVMVGAMPPPVQASTRVEPARTSVPFSTVVTKTEPTRTPEQSHKVEVRRTVEIKPKPAPQAQPRLAKQELKPEPGPAPQAAHPQPMPGTEGEIVRAQLTSAIRNREPTDKLSGASVAQDQLYYFTEIKGMAGQTVIHRWEYQGKVRHEQRLKVGSARYRTYSKKTLNPEFYGEWKVSAVDKKGVVLSSETFMLKSEDATAGTP
ncbi:MAG: DUF2914 domain-containing protein [Pseudomonadota bacterium]